MPLIYSALMTAVTNITPRGDSKTQQQLKALVRLLARQTASLLPAEAHMPRQKSVLEPGPGSPPSNIGDDHD